MQRVERHIFINNKIIDELCFQSKNLYNLANYHVRQEFIKTSKEVEAAKREKTNWIRYNELDRLLKKTDAYNALPAQTAQQTLRLLDKNWKAFFKSIKDWNKHPEKYLGQPKLPKYKHKTKGRNIAAFTNQQCKIKDGYISFPLKVLPPLKTKVTQLNQVRVIPQSSCYVIEVVYTKTKEEKKLNSESYLSVDIGLNNLATCTNNLGYKPFVINGRPLKSINQYFNKKKAKLMSFIGDKGFSNRIAKLTLKRSNKISDYLHKTSKFIIDYCVTHKIKTIVIGHNTGWKQEIKIGKKNNQSFVNVPFDKLIGQVEYKAENVGITVKVREESHSSKCSFLDLEKIKHHAKYLGRRIKRGLFKSAKGILINADCNGAYNILRKEVPNALANGIEVIGLHPVKIYF